MNLPMLSLNHELGRLLDKAAKLFVPEMRLTFIARHPDKPECYIVIGTDTTEGAIETLRKQDASSDGK